MGDAGKQKRKSNEGDRESQDKKRKIGKASDETDTHVGASHNDQTEKLKANKEKANDVKHGKSSQAEREKKKVKETEKASKDRKKSRSPSRNERKRNDSDSGDD